MSEIDLHQKNLMLTFADILKHEKALTEAEIAAKDSARRHSAIIAQHKTDLDAAWEGMEDLLRETGEIEVVLPGNNTDYRICWQKGRTSISAPDPDAVPDEYCKLERKPMLKQIGVLLDSLTGAGQPLPNWASYERGEDKLVWKPVKQKKQPQTA